MTAVQELTEVKTFLQKIILSKIPAKSCQQSQECKLICKMMSLSPENRPYCEEIIDDIRRINRLPRYRTDSKLLQLNMHVTEHQCNIIIT